MIDIDLEKFRLVWASWMLFLGVSLIFVHTIWHVHSFEDYIEAFITFDMPSSWCPTFMTAYGFSTLAASVIDGLWLKRVLRALFRFTGLGLLLIGIYTLYEFSTMEVFSLNLWYIYPQVIHVSQLLTGLMNTLIFRKSKL